MSFIQFNSKNNKNKTNNYDFIMFEKYLIAPYNLSLNQLYYFLFLLLKRNKRLQISLIIINVYINKIYKNVNQYLNFS